MSGDNIPFDIQIEIMRRLRVKSLIHFRLVSKAWKSLIDSSYFIARYIGQHTETQHLLVSKYSYDYERKIVSFIVDDNFPKHKVDFVVPPLAKMLRAVGVLGGSHCLLCLYSYTPYDYQIEMAVIWNISIRKAVVVIIPNMGSGKYSTVLGFGVCNHTNDPKIVKITYIIKPNDVESTSCIPWQVEVFTLSTGAWRSPCSNLPRKIIEFHFDSVQVDGFLYWLASDAVTRAFGFYNLIISFDITSEEFREIKFPHTLARYKMSMCKLNESLVVIEETFNQAYIVWMMEDGFPKSFTKLYTINIPCDVVHPVIGFRKSGELILHLSNRYCEEPFYGKSVGVYEPYSKHLNEHKIYETGSLILFPYMETLLLFDQPAFIIYNEGKHYISKPER